MLDPSCQLYINHGEVSKGFAFVLMFRRLLVPSPRRARTCAVDGSCNADHEKVRRPYHNKIYPFLLPPSLNTVDSSKAHSFEYMYACLQVEWYQQQSFEDQMVSESTATSIPNPETITPRISLKQSYEVEQSL